jgi:hypothetical protein
MDQSNTVWKKLVIHWNILLEAIHNNNPAVTTKVLFTEVIFVLYIQSKKKEKRLE